MKILSASRWRILSRTCSNKEILLCLCSAVAYCIWNTMTHLFSRHVRVWNRSNILLKFQRIRKLGGEPRVEGIIEDEGVIQANGHIDMCYRDLANDNNVAKAHIKIFQEAIPQDFKILVTSHLRDNTELVFDVINRKLTEPEEILGSTIGRIRFVCWLWMHPSNVGFLYLSFLLS